MYQVSQILFSNLETRWKVGNEQGVLRNEFGVWVLELSDAGHDVLERMFLFGHLVRDSQVGLQ